MTSADGLKDFEEFLDRYCNKHKKSTVEALEDAVVVEVGKYYGITDKEITSHLLKIDCGDIG